MYCLFSNVSDYYTGEPLVNGKWNSLEIYFRIIILWILISSDCWRSADSVYYKQAGSVNWEQVNVRTDQNNDLDFFSSEGREFDK